MEPIKFPEMTGSLAKAQPQFRPLSVHIMDVPSEGVGIKRFTTKYELSDLEIEQIIMTRSFYFGQIGNCFHPISPSVTSPFFAVEVLYQKIENGYDAWVKANDGTEYAFFGTDANELIRIILNKFMDLKTADQLYFREKSSLSVSEKGLEGM